jgi:hypothetical protein
VLLLLLSGCAGVSKGMKPSARPPKPTIAGRMCGGSCVNCGKVQERREGQYGCQLLGVHILKQPYSPCFCRWSSVVTNRW